MMGFRSMVPEGLGIRACRGGRNGHESLDADLQGKGRPDSRIHLYLLFDVVVREGKHTAIGMMDEDYFMIGARKKE
jgi:hypothetical protein